MGPWHHMASPAVGKEALLHLALLRCCTARQTRPTCAGQHLPPDRDLSPLQVAFRMLHRCTAQVPTKQKSSTHTWTALSLRPPPAPRASTEVRCTTIEQGLQRHVTYIHTTTLVAVRSKPLTLALVHALYRPHRTLLHTATVVTAHANAV